MIVADVSGLQECELQTITRELDESRKENEMNKPINEALTQLNEQLTTQLDEKNKLLITKNSEAQQLHRELQVSEKGRVHAKHQQA